MTDLSRFLDGVVGVVEATHTEKFFLWKEHHYNAAPERKLSWKEGGGGPLVTIGTLGDRPVVLSLYVDTIDEHRLAFIECTGQVCDWEMIGTWLGLNMPDTAFKDYCGERRLNRVTAGNFLNVMPRPVCDRPPEGWSCSRDVNHSGPCAALPTSKPIGMQSSLDNHSDYCNRQTGGTFCDCGSS